MQLLDHIKAEGLTLAAFADRVGVSQATISRYISGDRTPSVKMIGRIAAETGGAVGFVDWVDLTSGGGA